MSYLIICNLKLEIQQINKYKFYIKRIKVFFKKD